MENAINNLLNLTFDALDLEMREYAKIHEVPIIQDEGLAFLEQIVTLAQPKKILEIGTAIGYSAIRMVKAYPCEIYTIERNDEMVNIAYEFIQKAKLSDKIHVLHQDALEAFEKLKNQNFDLIFIDAAKAQYLNFFNLYTPLLNKNGVVVCDNMLFHGLVQDEENYENQSRSVRGLIRKLKNFHHALLENPNYKTSIFSIGDGMSISVKKEG